MDIVISFEGPIVSLICWWIFTKTFILAFEVLVKEGSHFYRNELKPIH